jgi:hypothetical protein
MTHTLSAAQSATKLVRRWMYAVSCAWLVACGDGSAPPVTASQVPNEVARSTITRESSMLLTVPANASGLANARIEVPAKAAYADMEIQVGYSNDLPGAFRPEALAAGAKAVSKTLVVKVVNGGPTALDDLVTITLPYDVAAAGGLPPVALYWDPGIGRYRAAAVTAIDRTAGTVSFVTSHFSEFVLAVAAQFAVTPTDVETGFLMGRDSILHPNFGTAEYFAGNCMGLASLTTYYYSQRKQFRLYNFAQDGVMEQPEDDEKLRSAAAMTHALIVKKIKSLANQLSIYIPTNSAPDAGMLMAQAMIVTGDPLHLAMFPKDPAKLGHSVVVYGYDLANKRYRIHDSNFPTEEVTLEWSASTGFGNYSKAAATTEVGGVEYFMANDDTFGAPAQFNKIITDWESGALDDLFEKLSIRVFTTPTDASDTGRIETLTLSSATKTKIKYEDNQSVEGSFNRPAGLQGPVYLNVYIDGVQQETNQLLDASGRFTVHFPDKLEQKANVMLLVSADYKNPLAVVYGFGKFTVEPDGKNFFINVGSETGDTTGWTAETRLLDSGQLFTPTKLQVVDTGFDPIATDLPTTLFGKHALRVNDEDNGYHRTLAHQKAKIPLSGVAQMKFHWAAVLEDPQHGPEDQPFVEVMVFNVTQGTQLYFKRFYTSDPGFTGWKDYQNGAWKSIPWQAVIVSLSSAAPGDEIDFSIIGADCGQGGHGGYVYMDAEE